jgi:hypothetical protein
MQQQFLVSLLVAVVTTIYTVPVLFATAASTVTKQKN